MSIVPPQPLVCIVLVHIIISSKDFEIEAKPKDVIPVPGWFTSVEGFVVPNLQKFQSKDSNDYLTRNIEPDGVSHLKRKRRKKKRMKAKKPQNFRNKLQAIRKKRKPKGKNFVFVNSNAKNKDYSAVSSSKEIGGKMGKTKPVDIIVHIKMKNE